MTFPSKFVSETCGPHTATKIKKVGIAYQFKFTIKISSLDFFRSLGEKGEKNSTIPYNKLFNCQHYHAKNAMEHISHGSFEDSLCCITH